MNEFFAKGAVALVTGASRGIGKAIAIDLAAQGVNVIVNYAKNESQAKQVQHSIIAKGGKCMLFRADISSSETVDTMFKMIRQNFGRLDILVNNAGIIDDGLIMQMSAEKFNRVMSTNLFGTFYATKQAIFLMRSQKQSGGSIINIASTSGIVGQEGQGNYAASKGGIISFSKVIAKEYANKGIRCNVVAPGFVATDMTNSLSPKRKQDYLKVIPLGRFGNPEEVANVVTFLASKKASYVTGKVVTVDGGLLM